MPIRGVTFDLWQTLLIDNQDLGRARMQIRLDGALEALSEVGEDISPDQVRDAYRQCYRTCHDIRDQDRDVSFMEQIHIFVGHMDPGLLDRLQGQVVQRIADVYADSLFAYPPPPHPAAAEVLQAAKDKGYLLGLISNTGMTPGVTFRAYMEHVGILGYFDHLTFSDEVRLAKPGRDIFLDATRGLGLEPEEVVHVGDHLLNDVFGAQQLGMKTIWIETHDERRKQVDVQPNVTVPSLDRVADAIDRLVSEGP